MQFSIEIFERMSVYNHYRLSYIDQSSDVSTVDLFVWTDSVLLFGWLQIFQPTILQKYELTNHGIKGFQTK